MRYNPLWQLTLVKLRDLWREPEALFWVFIFPVILALALGIAFPVDAAIGRAGGIGLDRIFGIAGGKFRGNGALGAPGKLGR